MRVRFRLNQLLTQYGVTGHGRITAIKNATGIERHKVSRLLDDAEDKISLQHLGEICRYLIDECHVDPRELPGALFEVEPSRFLALLRSTPTLRTCFGVRQRRATVNPPWAAGADSFLHGKLLELLLRPESAHGPPAGRRDDVSIQAMGRVRHSEIMHFHQEQVHAASGPLPEDEAERAEELRVLRDDAERVYEILHEPVSSSAGSKRDQRVKHVALMLGSVKSNPVCELSIARIFGAIPWGAHGRTFRSVRGSLAADLVKAPSERAVPFFLRYRDAGGQYRDAQIPSCHAGNRLATSRIACGNNGTIAGIYYEGPSGRWECAPWSATEDAAIVLFDHDRILGNVEVVMGGFSARATLLLGAHLEQIADHLFPATFETDERAVGAFIIRFAIAPEAAGDDSRLGHMPRSVRAPTVIRLDEKVLRPRLAL